MKLIIFALAALGFSSGVMAQTAPALPTFFKPGTLNAVDGALAVTANVGGAQTIVASNLAPNAAFSIGAINNQTLGTFYNNSTLFLINVK